MVLHDSVQRLSFSRDGRIQYGPFSSEERILGTISSMNLLATTIQLLNSPMKLLATKNIQLDISPIKLFEHVKYPLLRRWIPGHSSP